MIYFVLVVIIVGISWVLVQTIETNKQLRVKLASERTKLAKANNDMWHIANSRKLCQKDRATLERKLAKETERNNNIWETTRHLQKIINRRIRAKKRIIRKIPYRLTQEWDK